ncbi:MAG: PAS domain S-box protein, partial [Desulfuromonadales bacterium]|nr:PAS domain S-box protein [Desulfuromonadales bacterium]
SERKRGDEALKESEERLKALSEASFEAIFLSEKGICLDQNQTAERIFGFTRAEAVGRHGTEWIVPEDREQVNNNMLSNYKKPYEATALRKDGTTFPCEIQGRRINYQDRSIRITALRDITERRRAEKELLKSEERFKRIFENLQDVYYEAGMDGTILEVSPSIDKFSLYNRKDLIGKSLYEIYADPKERDEFVELILDKGMVNDYEIILKDKDGSQRPCSITTLLMRDSQGTPVKLVGSMHDISERKQADEALRESEDRYRTLVGTIPDPVVVYDSEGRATYVNNAFVRVYGWSREELMGGRIDFVPPEETEATQEAWRRTLEDGTVFFETKRWNKNGDLLDIQLRTAILRDQEGKHVLSIVIHRDVTALKQAETALRKAHDELEVRVEKRTVELAKANEELCEKIAESKQAEEEKLALERQVRHAQKLESLGVLAGGIAHDFNNILMAILGNADLALDELSPMSPARGSIRDIEKAAKRAAKLVKQMLAYSGKGRFVVEPIDVGGLIEEISHLLEVSISKKSVLKHNLAENLPTFDGDVTQIRQVIMNLITNASEAIGDKSGVIALSTGAMDCDRAYLDDINEVVRASLDEPLPEGVYTYIEVADTGCGMDAQTIEKVFDPFFTTKFTGRGLGMSAVLGIVRGHRGALKIYSEVGKGTTFKILFPANELPDNGFAVRRKDQAEGKDWRGSGTVLIADDEETVCTVVKKMLELMGFSVLTVPDGREALKLFREHANEIVCVLLDLTMPHMDGEETFRVMRRLHPGVTVILCSGYNEHDATQRFAGKGLAGFIQKPYNMAALRKKLMEVLRDERAAPKDRGDMA